MKKESTIDQKLREQLVKHLKGGHAFSPIEKVLEDIAFENLGIVPKALPYSFYQQFYHIWYAQHDIIEYCRNDNYEAPDWPKDYWPENTGPSDKSEWENLVQNFFTERDEFCEYLMDPTNDLFRPFQSNDDHNLLRETELIIEHNAYHIGHLYVLKRLISSYSENNTS